MLKLNFFASAPPKPLFSHKRFRVKSQKYLGVLALITVLLFFGSQGIAGTKSKYGSNADPLSLSHDYFRTHPSPQFWTLLPYYVSQQDGASCSVASVAMVVNAIREKLKIKLTAEDELVTQSALLEKVKPSVWKKALSAGRGITLDDLGPIMEESLKAYGIPSAQVEIVHTDNLSPSTRNNLHETLISFEKSTTYIIANFLQGIYTGDAKVGHISPIAAYDAAHQRILVLDTDRTWYGPYWISEKVFLKGMVTRDFQSGQFRGYIRIKLPHQ